jgi:SET domain-containing protein
VDIGRITITRAAKKLHIKLPTAKVILSNYRKKGEILKKKSVPKYEEKSSNQAQERVEAGGQEASEEAPGMSLIEPCPYLYILAEPLLLWPSHGPVIPNPFFYPF